MILASIVLFIIYTNYQEWSFIYLLVMVRWLMSDVQFLGPGRIDYQKGQSEQPPDLDLEGGPWCITQGYGTALLYFCELLHLTLWE